MNAAGLTHYSPLFVTNVETLEGILRTNLMGTMLACKIVGKGMIGNRPSGGEVLSLLLSYCIL